VGACRAPVFVSHIYSNNRLGKCEKQKPARGKHPHPVQHTLMIYKTAAKSMLNKPDSRRKKYIITYDTLQNKKEESVKMMGLNFIIIQNGHQRVDCPR